MKLTLNKETLRALESQEADQVQGGNIVIYKTLNVICVQSLFQTQCLNQCITHNGAPSICVLCIPPSGFTTPY